MPYTCLPWCIFRLHLERQNLHVGFFKVSVSYMCTQLLSKMKIVFAYVATLTFIPVYAVPSTSLGNPKLVSHFRFWSTLWTACFTNTPVKTLSYNWELSSCFQNTNCLSVALLQGMQFQLYISSPRWLWRDLSFSRNHCNMIFKTITFIYKPHILIRIKSLGLTFA